MCHSSSSIYSVLLEGTPHKLQISLLFHQVVNWISQSFIFVWCVCLCLSVSVCVWYMSIYLMECLCMWLYVWRCADVYGDPRLTLFVLLSSSLLYILRQSFTNSAKLTSQKGPELLLSLAPQNCKQALQD